MSDYEPLVGLAGRSRARQKDFRGAVKRLRVKRSGEIESILEELHQEAFEEIDCLECGNCCRSLGPRIIDRDVIRLGKALRMPPAEVYETYFHRDEDGDFVFKSMPCPFLGDDNYCFVYDSRPKACADYPHTEGRQVRSYLGQLVKNSETCPAVFYLLERLCQEV